MLSLLIPILTMGNNICLCDIISYKKKYDLSIIYREEEEGSEDAVIVDNKPDYGE